LSTLRLQVRRAWIAWPIPAGGTRRYQAVLAERGQRPRVFEAVLADQRAHRAEGLDMLARPPIEQAAGTADHDLGG
jgi:hypothetical protein